MKIKLYRLRKGARLPCYMSNGASGMDLHAVLEKPAVIQPGAREAIPTGLAIELPTGLEAQIRPRSGLALSHGMTVLNAPGTVDSDYRGEIRIILINHGNEPVTITDGMRVAQMVIARVERVEVVEAEDRREIEDTQRGGGGFGHTGVS